MRRRTEHALAALAAVVAMAGCSPGRHIEPMTPAERLVEPLPAIVAIYVPRSQREVEFQRIAPGGERVLFTVKVGEALVDLMRAHLAHVCREALVVEDPVAPLDNRFATFLVELETVAFDLDEPLTYVTWTVGARVSDPVGFRFYQQYEGRGEVGDAGGGELAIPESDEAAAGRRSRGGDFRLRDSGRTLDRAANLAMIQIVGALWADLKTDIERRSLD